MVILKNKRIYAIGCLLWVAMVLVLGAGCTKVDEGTTGLTGPTGYTTTTITLESSASQVNNGSTFTLAVKAYKVSNLFGAAFDLSYDTSKIKVQTVADGGFLFYAMTPQKSEGSNLLTVGLSSQADSSGNVTGVDGDGTLCNITFKAVGAGTTEIKVVSGSAKFYDTSLVATSPDIDQSVTITVN